VNSRITGQRSVTTFLGRFVLAGREGAGAGTGETAASPDRCDLAGRKLQVSFGGYPSPAGLPRFAHRTAEGTAAVFVGELFNFVELCSQSGGEDLLADPNPAALCCRLFRRSGLDFAARLNGMFSLCLEDEKEDSFLLLVDKLGSAFPVFYHRDAEELLFSNQLKTLLGVPGRNWEIDTAAFGKFLKYSYIPAPATIFKGVQKLGPGEALVGSGPEVRRVRYHDFLAAAYPRNPGGEVEEYLGLLKDSVRRRVNGQPPEKVGFFLSGGLDSSANVILAAELGFSPLQTFGIGFGDPQVDERPHARLVAETFGAEFSGYEFAGPEIEDLPRMVWFLDQPFMENGLFLTYAAFKSAASRVETVLAGDGADQIFGTGGFAGARPIALRWLLDRARLTPLVDRLRQQLFTGLFHRDNPLFKLKVLTDRVVDFNDWFYWGFDLWELRQLCRFDLTREDLACFAGEVSGPDRSFAGYYRFASIRNDLEHYAGQNVLVKSSRMADLFGLRVREPYLDDRVIDFVLSLDLQLKAQGKLRDYLTGNRSTKYLHRLTMQGVMPPETLERKKQGGCIPMKILLADPTRRGALYDYVLGSECTRHFFRTKFLRRLFAECERLYDRGAGWEAYLDCRINQVMNLVVVALWFDIVYRGDVANPPAFSLSAFLDR